MTAADEGYPRYPHTPEEHTVSFLAQVRAVSDRLYNLSQEVYQEMAGLHPDTKGLNHAGIAENVKRILNQGVSKISADHLVALARAADKAHGQPGNPEN